MTVCVYYFVIANMDLFNFNRSRLKPDLKMYINLWHRFDNWLHWFLRVIDAPKCRFVWSHLVSYKHYILSAVLLPLSFSRSQFFFVGDFLNSLWNDTRCELFICWIQFGDYHDKQPHSQKSTYTQTIRVHRFYSLFVLNVHIFNALTTKW